MSFPSDFFRCPATMEEWKVVRQVPWGAAEFMTFILGALLESWSSDLVKCTVNIRKHNRPCPVIVAWRCAVWASLACLRQHFLTGATGVPSQDKKEEAWLEAHAARCCQKIYSCEQGSFGNLGFLWVPLGSFGFLWVPLVPLGSFGFLWVPLGSFLSFFLPSFFLLSFFLVVFHAFLSSMRKVPWSDLGQLLVPSSSIRSGLGPCARLTCPTYFGEAAGSELQQDVLVAIMGFIYGVEARKTCVVGLGMAEGKLPVVLHFLHMFGEKRLGLVVMFISVFLFAYFNLSATGGSSGHWSLCWCSTCLAPGRTGIGEERGRGQAELGGFPWCPRHETLVSLHLPPESCWDSLETCQHLPARIALRLVTSFFALKLAKRFMLCAGFPYRTLCAIG